MARKKGGGGGPLPTKPGLTVHEKELKKKYELLRERKRKKREGFKEESEKERVETAKKILAATIPTLSQETKDTGFKRPAKLQRKLNEIKENPALGEETKRRKLSSGGEAESQDRSSHGGSFASRGPEEEEGTATSTGGSGSGAYNVVFVGNLGEMVTERDVAEAFARFGAIESVRLVPGKNFGFVTYTAAEPVYESIAAMDGQVLGSTHIRVSKAKPNYGLRPWRRPFWERRDSWGEGSPSWPPPHYARERMHGGPPQMPSMMNILLSSCLSLSFFAPFLSCLKNQWYILDGKYKPSCCTAIFGSL
ncbi:RNA recognition motif domain containing protein [Balamuthia mandrillaris]